MANSVLQGAEPVFLHVIRPAVKPYAATLDAMSDAVASIAEFLLLLVQVPVDLARQQYYLAVGQCRRLLSAWYGSSADDGGRSEMYSAHSRDSSSTDSRLRVSESSGFSRLAISREPSSYSSTASSVRQPYDSSRSSTPVHQIWRPPPSAYADEDGHTGLPTPPLERLYRPLPPEGLPPIVDEWRQYPAFPSAYPPTPIAAPMPLRTSAAQFGGIREEDEIGVGDPPDPSSFYGSSRRAGSQQGFRRSLQLPRESRNPDSDGGLSDDNEMNGVHERTETQTTHQPHSLEQQADDVAQHEDEEMGDDSLTTVHMSVDEASGSDAEDDASDVSLGTPARFRRRWERAERENQEELKPFPLLALQIADSTDSRASRSTTLSTTDDGSELRTRTNSAASQLSSVSDASSVAGRKRRLPRHADDDAEPPRKDLFELPVEQHGKSNPPKKSGPRKHASGTQTKTIGRRSGKLLLAATNRANEGRLSEDEASGEEDGAVKRQRVPGAPRGRVLRPAPRREDSDKTIRGPPSRSSTSANPPGQPPIRSSSRLAQKRPTLPRKATTGATTSSAGSGLERNTVRAPVTRKAVAKAK